ERHYGSHADAGNLDQAVYGIPELFREEIAGAELIANPGCYPTSVILGIAPLIEAGLVDIHDIVVDSKSGVTGRGNKPSVGSMYCECNENLSPYKVGSHRHAPEMEQGINMLSRAEDQPEADVLFVPHLAPMDRGILSTIYVRLCEGKTPDLQEIYEQCYGNEHFVRVLPRGELPRTKDVVGTNYCDVAVTQVSDDRAVVTSAIDNLARGAASQAVQNMNASFHLDETLGIA
ncbi:MAG: N-acetyl-gamma-glutamyl-phosphate reductase, partial [Planctomycetota bacterium]